MTEQQILDKTIEYLNKYSNNFTRWHTDEDYHSIQLFAEVNSDDIDVNHVQPLDWLIKKCVDGIKVYDQDYHWGKFHADNVMISEFRIAYNIVKDLAQHENEDQTGNVNFGHLI